MPRPRLRHNVMQYAKLMKIPDMSNSLIVEAYGNIRATILTKHVKIYINIRNRMKKNELWIVLTGKMCKFANKINRSAAGS